MKPTVRIAMLVGSLTLASGVHAEGRGAQLIAANKCSMCHSVKKAPAELTFAAIAEKYKGQADATAKLVDLLKTGGLAEHDKVAASDADLKAIVAVVLASK